MAATITQSIKFSWSDGLGDGLSFQVTDSFTQVGNAVFTNVQTINGTSAQVSFGAASGDAILGLKNNAPKWSTLSTEEKGAYADEADYKTKNAIYVGTTNPATSNSANTSKLYPGQGLLKPGTLENHYAIRDTNSVDLLVMIFER